MRAGGCTVQQTLTAEAAGVVKHAVALARRRGHAQVTPLHVASALLASGTASILRRACLKSHPHSTSHPLQCRALDLCFNVALNRLPTTAGAGPLGQPHPSLSNALVAALKRAQAHQRRGCLEQQQQPPLLAVKVEMEQLLISILDDPSVSRVMREAGFSSTFVKTNLEEAVSVLSAVNPRLRGGLPEDIAGLLSPSPLSCLPPPPPPLWHQHQHQHQHQQCRDYRNPRLQASLMDDLRSAVEVLLRRRRRNAVLVGDCPFSSENVVREFMVRAQRGDVPEVLKPVQFVTPAFLSSSNYSSLRLLRRDDVEQKVGELRRMVNNCVVSGGAIIYAGDLKWAVDGSGEDCPDQKACEDSDTYCPVGHICVELGRILASHADSQRVWLMATATYQTYIRCQTRQPSLETLWGLQAVPIPSGGLSLTLNHPSVTNAQSDARSSGTGTEVLASIPQMPALKTLNSDDRDLDKLNCCSECSANFEREAQAIAGSWIRLHPNISTAPTESYFSKSNETRKSPPNLPFWLHQCENDNAIISRSEAAEPQVDERLEELRTRWNLICRGNHDPEYIAQQHCLIRGHASGDGKPILIEDLQQHSVVGNKRAAFNSQASLAPVPWWSCASQKNPDFAATSLPQTWSVVPTPLASMSNGTSTIPDVVNVGNPTWKTHQFWTVENGRTEQQHRDIITSSDSIQLPPDSSNVKPSVALGVKSPGGCSISEQANARNHNDIEDWVRPDITSHRSRILNALRLASDLHTELPPPSRMDTRSPDSILSMGNERIGQEYTLQRLSGKFRQFDAESLKSLCKGLEERVPWQSHVTTAIASTVLECRSGMTRRHFSKLNHVKGDTWLLVLGPDRMGKTKIAKALADVVFGSEDNVVAIGMARSEDEDNSRLRRGKTQAERLTEALRLHPHSVVLLEDIEQANTVFMTAIVKAMERGKLIDSEGKEVGLSDAIVLMTSSLGSKYFTSPSVKGVPFDEDKLAANRRLGMKLIVEEEQNKDHSLSALKYGDSQQSQVLDICNGSNSQDLEIGNVGNNNNDSIGSCKRKAGWDNEMRAESIGRHALETAKRSRRNTSTDLPQSIALDLNLSADRDDDPADQDGSTTGNSDITTQETVVQKDRESALRDEILSCARDQQIFSPDFFKFLDNCVVLRPFDFGKVAEGLLITLNRSYSRATDGRGSLQVDSSVLEQIVLSSWESAPKSLFEKWVEDVFEYSLAMAISLHTITPRTVVRLTVVNHHRGANLADAFYDNSSLPRRLEVSII